MRFWRYFFTFGTAFLIFSAVLVSENARYNLFSQIENPLGEESQIQKTVKIAEEKEQKSVTLATGESFVFYPGVEVVFSESNREVVDGELFMSTFLVDQDEISPLSEEIFQRGFTANDFSFRLGQMKVGKLYLSLPGSTVYIIRENSAGRTRIYVFGHSLQVYFEGAKHPFVIPAGRMIDVRDSLINQNTPRLYYTKQVKDFRMRTFHLPASLDEKSVEPEQRLLAGVQQQAERLKKMGVYAQLAPQSWLMSPKSELFEKIIQPIRVLQSRFALGYPREKRVLMDFEVLVYPFVKAVDFTQDGKLNLAKRELEDFRKNIASSEWKELMRKDSEGKRKWQVFVRSQKGWLGSRFSNDPFQLFSKFWADVNGDDSFQELKKSFSQIEILIANGRNLDARERMTEMEVQLRKAALDPSFRYEITAFRRIVGEWLSQDKIFQKPAVFTLYKTLLKKELELHTDPDFVSEIRLEAAQYLLSFLNTFLRKETDVDVARILLDMYDRLNVNEIAKGLGRNIFTKNETEMIAFLEKVGRANLTREQIESLERGQEYVASVQKRFQEIEKIEDLLKRQQQEEQVDPDFIDESKELFAFLRESGINMDAARIQGGVTSEMISFAQGLYLGKTVSSRFDVKRQFFLDFQVGDFEEQNFQKRFITGVLDDVRTRIENAQGQSGGQRNTIPQTTRRAVLERNLVQKLLETEGFTVSRESIEILDQNMTRFSIRGAQIGEIRGLSFSLNNKAEIISQVRIEEGRDQVNLGARTFPVRGSGTLIPLRIQVLTGRSKK